MEEIATAIWVMQYFPDRHACIRQRLRFREVALGCQHPAEAMHRTGGAFTASGCLCGAQAGLLEYLRTRKTATIAVQKAQVTEHITTPSLVVELLVDLQRFHVELFCNLD